MMLIILLNKQSDFTTTTHSQDRKLYKDIHTDKQCIRRIHLRSKSYQMINSTMHMIRIILAFKQKEQT